VQCTTPSISAFEFVSQVCIPGDASSSTQGLDSVIDSCRYHREGYYVSALCTPGTASQLGFDTDFSPCSEPIFGETFVLSECIAGTPNQLGSDTVIGNCSVPLTGQQYISDVCHSGNSTSVGRDTKIKQCSPIPIGHYVTSPCITGSYSFEGADTETLPCSEPSQNTYVTVPCVSGTAVFKGANTQTKNCATVINTESEGVSSGCLPGSSRERGSDSMIISKCPVGFLLNTTDPYRACVACPDGRSTIAEGADSCDICRPGNYMEMVESNNIKKCIPCPLGGECSGYQFYPIAAPGYIATAQKDVFVKCIPSTACISSRRDGSTSDYLHRPKDFESTKLYCEEGYSGFYCDMCYNDGVTYPRYYRSISSGSVCVKCPENDMGLLLFGNFVLAVVSITGGYFLYTKLKLRKQLIVMIVNFLQLLSTVSNLRLNWTRTAQSALKLSMPFNFNLETVQPDCTIRLSFLSRWIITQLLPLIAIILLVLINSLIKCTSQWISKGLRFFTKTNASPENLALKPHILAVRILSLFNLFYLMIVVNTFAVFDCVGATTRVLNSEPSVVCDESDPSSPYKIVRPLAFLSMVVYVIGVPIFHSFVLYMGMKKCTNYVEELPPEGDNVGDTVIRSSKHSRRSTINNRAATTFYEALMQDVFQVYKEDVYYWRIVETLRKFMVVMVIRLVSSEEALMQSYLLTIGLFAYPTSQRSKQRSLIK
jgi:hypothetical protein